MVAPGWQVALDGLLAHDPQHWHPVLDLAGLTPTSFGEGTAHFVWMPPSSWLNPGQRTVFGGAAATVLEASYGLAMATLIEDGEQQAAVRLETDFVRPAFVGQRYRVTGQIVDRAGQMMFCRGEIVDDDGRSVALGSGVCRIIRPRT